MKWRWGNVPRGTFQLWEWYAQGLSVFLPSGVEGPSLPVQAEKNNDPEDDRRKEDFDYVIVEDLLVGVGGVGEV